MTALTNEQFRKQIENWQEQIAKANIKLPNGEPLPDKFFHVFLGVGYSTFKKMVSGNDSRRVIQPYTARTVRFIKLLDNDVFLGEVKLVIPEYIKLYGVSNANR